ncbi:DUF4365 domain-containing protein [Nocardia ignorata]|uniref:DUF4365 domain-containing protein n=1 Tax=Nocardia ignorata TaxID=145285 RepID=UPI003633CD72
MLEDEARTAFKALIEPLGWVVRAADAKDYGVDDEVEIFDSGQATGLKFYVQSRGTDKVAATPISMRLRTAQQNYFAALDLPVLLARYHAPSKRTYVQWFHRFDPYPRRMTQTIRFDADSELTSSTARRLASEMAIMRAWQRRTLRWPLRLRVVSTSVHDQRDLELHVARLAGGTNVITVNGPVPEDGPCLDVVVTSESVRVDAVLTHTVHGERRWVDEVDRSIVAGEILRATVDVLDKLGFGAKAAPLLESVLRVAPVRVDLAEWAGDYFARASRMDCALRVASYWLEHATTVVELAASMLALISTCSRGGRDEEDMLRAAGETLRRIGETALTLKSEDRVMVAASAFIAAARTKFRVGEWQDADQCFSRAVELDEMIPSQGILLAEVAGAAHQAGDYHRAVDLYTAAIELCPNNARLLARRADSLLHEGRLTDAAAEFERYFAHSADAIEIVWELKAQTIQFLRASGIRDGPRNPAAAQRILAARDPGDNDNDTRRRCLRAAQHDPLHTAAWTELGQLDMRSGRTRRAAAPLLISALTDRRPARWAMALMAAFQSDLQELATDVAALGLFEFGEEFHLAVRAVVDTDADQSPIVSFVEEIDRKLSWQRRPDTSEAAGE